MFGKLFSSFKGGDSDEIKPSTQPVDGKITYKFQCGIEAHQEELNLEQDEALTHVLLGFNLDSFSLENSSIMDLVDMLIREKSLLKILGIILVPSGEKRDYSKLKNSELRNVLNDFFSLNPTAINWLKTIGGGLTSLPLTPPIESSSKR